MTKLVHLKIALTSNDLVQVDSEFLTARQFVMYGLTRETAQFLDVVQFKDRPAAATSGEGGEKKGGGRCCSAGAPGPAIGNSVDARIEALEGTSVLFTLGMSDPQSVRVANLGVFPIKLAEPRSIYEVLDRLQDMLKGVPPLWLGRVLRPGPIVAAA